MSIEVCCRRNGLFIFYLLKNIKQKQTQIFSVLKNVFSSWFLFRKNCGYIFLYIEIIRKGAHLNFAMGASLHRYAPG